MARALVLCSGGLDSVVLIGVAQDGGYVAGEPVQNRVSLLYADYGQRAEMQERKAVVRVAVRLRLGVRTVDLRWLGELGASALTGTGQEALPTEPADDPYPPEWVPARNVVLVACAAAIADAKGFDAIYVGADAQASELFPDHRPEFYEEWNDVLALGAKQDVVVKAPLAERSKVEIVRLAAELGSPVEESWSCYDGGPAHCGQCNSCRKRMAGFRDAGYIDPVDYRPAPEHGYWDGCNQWT